MSIMFLKVRSVSRGRGDSAVAKAAYISRSRLVDQRTGKAADYRRVPGLQHSEILLPAGVGTKDAQWLLDRKELWNAAESAEPRRNARVGREYTIALPHELTPDVRRDLARSYGQLIADRYGVVVDVAVHGPTQKGDPRNHHAHLLATTREVDGHGFGRKATIERSSTARHALGMQHISQEFRELRAQWAQRANERLREAGSEARLEHRSRRTIERERAAAIEPNFATPVIATPSPAEPSMTMAQRAAANWRAYRQQREATPAQARTRDHERSRGADRGFEM
jgi:ATP-dependent exoDNAse (exonuclease V) alpha subunit